MTGEQRAMLYRLASETGLRASEIRSLRRSDLQLGEDASVTVRAAYSKRRREDVQPIRRAFADMLGAFVADLPTDGQPFSVPDKPAKMLRVDLRVARARWIRAIQDRTERRKRRESSFLVYRDDAGHVLDFQAFRHTDISRLAQGGVHPSVAQRLARHSTITLTMDRYTHTLRGDLWRALDALPDLETTPDQPQELRATGTDQGVPSMCHSSVRNGPQVSNAGTIGDKRVAPPSSLNSRP